MLSCRNAQAVPACGITARQTSCGKFMFSRASVSHSVEGLVGIAGPISFRGVFLVPGPFWGWVDMSRGVSKRWVCLGGFPGGGVCLRIIRGQGGYVQGGIQGYPEYMGHGILQDTVDMRAVRTLLECFLVLFIFCFVLLTVEDLDNPGNVYAPYNTSLTSRF